MHRNTDERGLSREHGLPFIEIAPEFQAILDSMPFYAMIIDSRHYVHMANRAVQQALKLDPGQLVGQFCPKAVHGLDGPFHGCPLEESVDKGCCSVEKEFWDEKTGRWIASSVFPVPGRAGDGSRLFFHMIRDITDVKALERQNAVLAGRMHQSQKMEAVASLATSVAVDFSDVLAGIISCAELIKSNTGQSSVSVECARLIIESSQSAVLRLQRLLSLSTKAATAREPVDVHSCIRSSIEYLTPRKPGGVVLETRLGARRYTTLADHLQIEEALCSLGMNAVEAIPGGGTVTFSTQNLDADEDFLRSTGLSLPRGTCLEVCVADTGAGMDEATDIQIFEPCYAQDSEGRAGLGLAAVYAMVKRHNGDVAFSSKRNEGTRVQLYLPVCEVPGYTNDAAES